MSESRWSDMSPYVVHFTKPTPDMSASSVLRKILSDGFVAPTTYPVGGFRRSTPVNRQFEQFAACFSEVPLNLLHRIIRTRSSYGVGFRQDVMHRRQAERVWYVEKDTLTARHLQTLVERLALPGADSMLRAAFWSVAPYIDLPGDYGATSYRFEWEREWRATEGLRFNATEVAFVFLPESEHASMTQWMLSASIGWPASRPTSAPSAFDAPFIDPAWEAERIQDALG